MNKNDVIIFGLVAAMVIAVATAVTARYPDANIGSVADWCAAVGSIFAASTALYIAHHEARRARDLLADEKADATAREARTNVEKAEDRRRMDAIAVQAAVGALTEGLNSCKSMAAVIETGDPEHLRVSAKAFLASARFAGPTAVMAGLMPGAANLAETTAYLLEAKSAWGACCSRADLLANYNLTQDQIASVMSFNDARVTLRKGLELHWRLCNNWSDPLPPHVDAEVERVLKFSSW